MSAPSLASILRNPIASRSPRFGLLTTLSALAVFPAVLGCSSPALEEELPDEPNEEEPAPRLLLTLSTERLPVLQGTEVTLTAHVERKNGFSGEVQLSAQGLPPGATLEAVTLLDDEDEAELTLSAPSNAPHSLPTEVTIVAEAGNLRASESLTVTVYGPPGSLDTSFLGGKVTTQVGPSDAYANAMTSQKDGKLIVVGNSYDNRGDFALVRFEQDGQIDEAFGDHGQVLTQVGEGSDVARAVAIDAEGRILVAGSSDSGATGLDFALVRYLEDGSLDTNFGEGGKVTTALSSDADTPYALVIQNDGKIVVAGDASLGSSSTGQDFALVRYLEDGSLDESFGEGGKVLTALSAFSGRDTVYALTLQDIDGEQHIVAAGGEGDFSCARYRKDGRLDTTFGDGGKVTGLFGSTIGAARGVRVLGDDSLVLAGHSGHDVALAKLTEHGDLSESFGNLGLLVTPVSDTNWDEAVALEIEAEGNIVVAGWVYEGNSSSGNTLLLRYDAKGELDAGFGQGGIVETQVAASGKSDLATALLLQNDPRVPAVRVLVAGNAADSFYQFALSRFWR
jgi:uncharacterized delta-60 repeat protein